MLDGVSLKLVLFRKVTIPVAHSSVLSIFCILFIPITLYVCPYTYYHLNPLSSLSTFIRYGNELVAISIYKGYIALFMGCAIILLTTLQ